VCFFHQKCLLLYFRLFNPFVATIRLSRYCTSVNIYRTIGRYSLRNIPPLRKGPRVGAKSSYTADEKFTAKHCTIIDGHVC
jgi:hypothetical protein